jgi:hypothetical protein
MAMTKETIEAINQAVQRLPIKPVRVAELPVELGQFADVMDRVRHRLTFDLDPSDFLRARNQTGTPR